MSQFSSEGMASVRGPLVLASLLAVVSLTGCNPSRHGAKIVATQFPGQQLRDTSVSKNGQYFCGEVVDGTASRKFYVALKNDFLVTEGGPLFTIDAYQNACDVVLTPQQRAALEAHLAKLMSEVAKKRQQSDRDEVQRKWQEENGEAIKALHDASRKPQ